MTDMPNGAVRVKTDTPTDAMAVRDWVLAVGFVDAETGLGAFEGAKELLFQMTEEAGCLTEVSRRANCGALAEIFAGLLHANTRRRLRDAEGFRVGKMAGGCLAEIRERTCRKLKDYISDTRGLARKAKRLKAEEVAYAEESKAITIEHCTK